MSFHWIPNFIFSIRQKLTNDLLYKQTNDNLSSHNLNLFSAECLQHFRRWLLSNFEFNMRITLAWSSRNEELSRVKEKMRHKFYVRFGQFITLVRCKHAEWIAMSSHGSPFKILKKKWLKYKKVLYSFHVCHKLNVKNMHRSKRLNFVKQQKKKEQK